MIGILNNNNDKKMYILQVIVGFTFVLTIFNTFILLSIWYNKDKK